MLLTANPCSSSPPTEQKGSQAVRSIPKSSPRQQSASRFKLKARARLTTTLQLPHQLLRLFAHAVLPCHYACKSMVELSDIKSLGEAKWHQG
eukprot:142771-Amphidinium_carterae.1